MLVTLLVLINVYSGQMKCHGMGGLHYVIDTSRNGAETDTWLNPDNAKIGTTPTMDTDIENVMHFLWIKLSGESDGKAQGALKQASLMQSMQKGLLMSNKYTYESPDNGKTVYRRASHCDKEVQVGLNWFSFDLKSNSCQTTRRRKIKRTTRIKKCLGRLISK